MTKHKYPSRYPKGVHWATDEGWRIMDKVTPGAIPDEVRFFLSGCIAGSVMSVAEDPQKLQREWEAKHGSAKKGRTG